MIRVLGPRALPDRLDALHGYPFSAGALDTSVLGTGPHLTVIFNIMARLVTHTDESYAIRVAPTAQPGSVVPPGLVYSGDCGVAMDIAPLMRPGDTLLAEVSFGPGPVPDGVPHLDGPSVGRLATATSAARALLTPPPDGLRPRGDHHGDTRPVRGIRGDGVAGDGHQPLSPGSLTGPRSPRPGRSRYGDSDALADAGRQATARRTAPGLNPRQRAAAGPGGPSPAPGRARRSCRWAAAYAADGPSPP